jgi:HEAT repeat protein
MKAGDVKVRSAVVDTLGSIPGPEAVRALADQLVAERDFAVRRRAVNGLWLTDDPRLEAPVDITRLPGRRRLTAAEAKVAVPALIRVLRELNDLRKGPVKIVDSERHALRWPSEMDLDYRVSCVLNEIGEPAVPALAELLKDPDKDLRGSALQVLTFMNPEAKTAVLAILSCLDDKEPDIRAGVAYALSRQDRGAPETLPILRRLLRDSSAKVRITAATSILWLGPSDEAIFVLLEELRDPQSDAGRQAAASLEGLKSDEKRLVVVPTIGLLGSPLVPAPLLGASMLFPGGRREVSGTIPLPK